MAMSEFGQEQTVEQLEQHSMSGDGPDSFDNGTAAYLRGGLCNVVAVSVADGTQSAEPISFFTVRAGKITQMVEYWRNPFPAAANRSYLVERME
jgi:hypothetical protein